MMALSSKKRLKEGMALITRPLEAEIMKNITSLYEEMINIHKNFLNQDWGEIEPEDWQRNNLSALGEGDGRIVAKYSLSTGNEVLVISEDLGECDSPVWVTTFMLPDEY